MQLNLWSPWTSLLLVRAMTQISLPSKTGYFSAFLKLNTEYNTRPWTLRILKNVYIRICLLSNTSVDQTLQPNTVSHLRTMYINGRGAWKTGKHRDLTQFPIKADSSEPAVSEQLNWSLWDFFSFPPHSVRDHEKKGIYVQFSNEGTASQWMVIPNT